MLFLNFPIKLSTSSLKKLMRTYLSLIEITYLLFKLIPRLDNSK